MEMYKTIECLVWGNDNFNTLGLMRQLSTYSSVLFVINKKNRYCTTLSRYCKFYKIVKDEKSGLDFILEYGKNKEHKIYLFTTSDLLAEMVDDNQLTLKQHYHIMSTDKPGKLHNVINKYLMTQIAESVGFATPKTWEISDIEPNDLEYPCIVKPAFKSLAASTKFKTRICNSEKDYRSVIKNLNDGPIKYIGQTLIPKTHDVLVYGCRIYSGKVILAGSFIKDRWNKGGDGSHGIISCKVPDYISISYIESFLEKVGYYGLFSFEFGLYNDVAYYYETNFRNDGTSHYFYQAGCNLPVFWVESNETGKDVPTSVIRKDQFVIDEINDIDNVQLGIISKSQYKKDKKMASIFVFRQKGDMLPYYSMKLQRLIIKVYSKLR